MHLDGKVIQMIVLLSSEALKTVMLIVMIRHWSDTELIKGTQCRHCNRNVAIWSKFSSLAALEIVILTILSAANDNNFLKVSMLVCYTEEDAIRGEKWYFSHLLWWNQEELSESFVTDSFQSFNQYDMIYHSYLPWQLWLMIIPSFKMRFPYLVLWHAWYIY